MWQVLLGVYFIVTILVVVLLWSSLVLAKRADRNNKSRVQPGTAFFVGDENNPSDNHVLELPTMNELSKK